MTSKSRLTARALLLCVLLLLAGCAAAGSSTSQTPTAPPPSPASCGEIVQTALEAVDDTCDNLGRNQACYGSRLVQAEFKAEANGQFEAAGDIADLGTLKLISTTAFDQEQQTWGVALIKAQANLPDSIPGQNVTFLLYGGASLDNVSSDMQAVILSSGVGGVACAEAPTAALVVQSPNGTEVKLNINGANLTLGSTLYVSAVQNEEMTIATIEGTGLVESFGVSQVVNPGTQVRLPLAAGDGRQVSGPPSEPQPFEVEQVRNAPVGLLERPVAIPSPQTPPPTLTPTSEVTPLPTQTLAAPTEVQSIESPTPAVVSFRAASESVVSGECTMLSWDAVNAQSVLFEGQPAQTSGSREVCPTRTTRYTLLVAHADGVRTPYYVSITVEESDEDE